MALSGTVKTNSYEGRYYELSWTAKQSVSANTSTISWTLKAIGGEASWYAERTLNVSIGGSSVYSKTARVERYAETIDTGTKVITHSATGTASFSVSINVAVYTSTVNCKGSGTFTLDTIPRKSTLSVGNGTLGTAQTLTVTRQSTSFTHTISYKCGSASGTIATKSTSTSLSFTPPMSLASQNTTGTSLSITYTITTYNGNTSVGSNTYTKTLSIPASVKPSCTLSVSDAMGHKDTYGAYLKGLSKFKITVGTTLSYGSPIASYKVTANGTTYTTASFTTDALKSSGSLKISVTVTDKRGRTATAETTVNVLAYSAPVVELFKVRRQNESGSDDEQGGICYATSQVLWTTLGGSNSINCRLEYKKTTDEAWTSVYVEDGERDYNGDMATSWLPKYFDADTSASYNVRIVASDNFYTVTKTTVLSTGFTLMNFLASGLGMAFGKVAELENVLDIGFKTRFTGGIFQPVLEDGTDLDNVTVPNVYSGNSASSSGYVHCPITTGTSFTLEVMSAGGGGQLMQRITSCTKTTPIVYIRHYYSGAWGDWITM